jgi:phosphoglycolate phosphatase-like HAD superfamily hydrolase
MTNAYNNSHCKLSFDADGVLLNSGRVAATAYEDIAGLFGPRPSIRTIRDRAVAWGADAQVQAAGVDGAPTLNALHRILMRDRASQVQRFDKPIAIIDRLAHRPSLITAAFASGVRVALGRKVSLFNNIQGCEDGPKDRLIAAAAAGGLKWYVTDTVRDVHRCRNSGVRVIGVGWGYDGRAGLATAAPDFIVDTARELAAALTDLGFLSPDQ